MLKHHPVCGQWRSRLTLLRGPSPATGFREIAMFGGAVTLSMRDVILCASAKICNFPLWKDLHVIDMIASLFLPGNFHPPLNCHRFTLAPTCKGNPLPSLVHCVGFKRNARWTSLCTVMSKILGHQWQQIEFENSYDGLATLAFCFVRQIHLPLSTQIYGSS